MAVSTDMNTASNTFLGRLHAILEGAKAAHARRRVYRTTLSEMISLSDRELADLGLHRSQLRRVAYQAAYEVNAA